MHVLDFEKPIIELEQKLQEMRQFNSENPDSDLSSTIDAMNTRIHSLRESVFANLTNWQRVQIARHPDRPYSLDFIQALTEDFAELHGDRAFADDPAMVCGFGTFKGAEFGYRNRTVLMVGHQKGRDTKSRKYRRFGMPNPEGYRKALRLMKLAAKFGKPIICLLDTPGAYPGLEAEERGQAEAIARNLLEMARLPVPIVVAVVGEGASGGALGIGVGDKILMLENAWYSVISPESCSSILWRSWDHKEKAASALKLTAQDLVKVNVIDEIVAEPLGGAHYDPHTTYRNLGVAIAQALAELEKLSIEKMLDERLAKFDAMGAFTEG
jgi:acetyl-CoA carboxylase carboxyl transferase subunit alpha